MKKYLKIFVVCFALVALFTVSCFATSVQTTSTTAAYGHYISPGAYVFNEVLSTTFSFNFRFKFTNDSLFSYVFNSFGFFTASGGLDVDYYFRIYNGETVVYNLNVASRRSNGFLWAENDYRFITVLDGFYIYDPSAYQWWQSNVTRVSPGYDSNLLDGFFSSFTMIGQWISGAANTLTSMFWSNNSLTFLGTLAVSALAFAVAFLIIGLISRFLRFRG